MLRCYEGQHCSRSCCCSLGNMLPGNKWTHEYILDLVARFVPESVVYLPRPKNEVDYRTHTQTHTEDTQTKKNLIWVFLVKFQVAVKRNIMWTLEKAVLKRPDWFCYSVWNQAEHFSIPPNWFMNNLISLPANHGAASHEQVNCSFPGHLLVPPFYFTSTVDCSLHFQHDVWTEIAEEILPSAGAIHHQGCLAMKYRPGPTNNDSYLVC